MFICHSFKWFKHFGLAEITKRNDTSFGVMTMHKTKDGLTDPFIGLEDPLRYRFQRLSSRSTQIECFKRREQKIL
jgi:hypothetical protein